MIISLAFSRAQGFKKWSDAQKWTVDLTDSAEQSSVILGNSDADVIAHAVAERLCEPWLVPGVGSSI